MKERLLFLKRSCARIIIVVSGEQEGLDPKVKGMFQTSRLYQSSSALGKSFCPCQTTSESEVAKKSLVHVQVNATCTCTQSYQKKEWK